MKNITIKKDVWKRIRRIKEEKSIKNFSKTIEFLLHQYEKYSESFEDDDDDLEDNLDLPTPTDEVEDDFGRRIDQLIEQKSRWT